jgi:hypothetical protein
MTHMYADGNAGMVQGAKLGSSHEEGRDVYMRCPVW